MKFRLIEGRLLKGFAFGGFILAAAGCQSSDGGVGGETAPADKVLASELLAFCPKVTLREGTAYINRYAKGGEEDPTKLIYQASLADVTRSCSRVDGMMTINVAAAGRVVPGPAGAPGAVKLPIRVAVVRGEEVLYSQLHDYQVAVDSSGAAQFVFNDPNVTIPIPPDQAVRVFAGFDEGPPKQ
jgi:hypothetical protein